MTSRMTKEELREDRVASAAAQAVEYTRRNARWVVAAVAVMAVAVGVAVIFAQGRTKAERESAVALLRAQSAYMSGNFTDATTQFDALAGKYGSTRSGRAARLYLGNSQLASGNASAAEQSFRQFLRGPSKDPVQQAAGHRGLGASLLAQDKAPDAAAEYAQAAKIIGNPMAADDWLMAGITYGKAGNRTEAAAAFQQILDNYQKSQTASEARVRLKEETTAAN